MQVEGPRGAVVVNVAVEVEPRIEETRQGRDARLVQGDPLLGEERVEAQTGDVHHVQRKARHERITLDVIQVVGRVDPRKELPQKLQPSRLPRASPPAS